MIETYSTNLSVAADSSVPLNSIALIKGFAVSKQSSAMIELNKCGLYRVNVSASAIAATAGDIKVQLKKDGTLIPQTLITATASDTTSSHALSFETLIQVNRNNGPCCCSSPTTIEIYNAGVGVTFNNIDVTVTRLQ